LKNCTYKKEEKMSPQRDPEVFNQAHRLYLAGQFQQAYELLTEGQGQYPEHQRQLYFWRMCMAARQGNLELAEGIFTKALDEGYFYSGNSLRRDEDLKELQGRANFEALVARSMDMLAVVQKKAKPGLILLESVDTNIPQVPLLMALHGNDSNADHFQGYWNHLAEKGWLVALPQSSQVTGNNNFGWNDRAIAKKEIVDTYRGLTRKISIDPAKRIIAGFSMGGYTAIRAALQQYFPIRGFLGVAPFIRDLEEMERLLTECKADDLRGYFLLGEEDENCTPTALAFRELLVQANVPCGIEVFPGVAHDFPADYRSAIDRALHFILSE
jgi:dienelactone hydrolase